MKIGICDDEPLDVARIKKLVLESQCVDEECIIAEYTPESLAMDVAEDFFDCQILIMDIYFASKSNKTTNKGAGRTKGKASFDGVNLAVQINKKFPLCKIIFTSAYMDFTEHVYEADHVYFVLKKNLEHFLRDSLEKAIKVYREDARDNVVEFFHKGKKTWVKARDIFSVERFDRNIRIITNEEEYVCIKSLRQFADEVNCEPIVRCNSSTLVNLRHIKTMSQKKLTLENGKEYEISETYGENLKKAYLLWWCGGREK